MKSKFRPYKDIKASTAVMMDYKHFTVNYIVVMIFQLRLVMVAAGWWSYYHLIIYVDLPAEKGRIWISDH